MIAKSILITGCSSGIGLCVAQGLAARGWNVFASCRAQGDVERLRALGLWCVRLDVTDDASIVSALDAVLAASGGRLDALFNNAGYGQPGAVEDIGREALTLQFDTNVFGPWQLTRRVLAIMRKQGQGRVVFNSSILGFAAMKWRGAYNASKYAMEGLCDTLRLEMAGSGVEVVLIEPGPITSRFRHNALQQFLRHVDIEHSAHAVAYGAQLTRLRKEGAAAPFTLPPEAVLAAAIHALEAPRPRARYRVTFPTRLFWYLKRLLPTRWFDAVLRRAA